MSSIEIALLIILAWICVYSVVSVICKTYKMNKLMDSYNSFIELMEAKEDDESTREK
jgi:hypothetical protein